MKDKGLRVLIVDDSAVYRRILSDVIRTIPNAAVVGTAWDGVDTLAKLSRTSVDLVLLDVDMPKLGGLETLTEISEKYPTVGVVMVSGTNQEAADLTVRALAAGAIDFVAKPKTDSPERSRAELLRTLTPIINIVDTRRILQRASNRPLPSTKRVDTPPPQYFPRRQPSDAPTRQLAPPARFSMVAIGVSTGGPNALGKIVPELAENLMSPVLVVQHMPEGFTKSLATQLDRKSPLSIREAEDGERIKSGKVLIAPGGRHMLVKQETDGLVVSIEDTPPVNSCRPSADVLFSSLAKTLRGSVLTVTLTGMGKDGAQGIQELNQKSSYNIAQNEATSVVYGMAKAVVDKNLADEVLPLDRIAPRINELISHQGNRR